MTGVWIKDPLAILADGADRGMVVQNGIIAELVPKGGKPKTANVTIFEAGQHVIVPGLINTHHCPPSFLPDADARSGRSQPMRIVRVAENALPDLVATYA